MSQKRSRTSSLTGSSERKRSRSETQEWLTPGEMFGKDSFEEALTGLRMEAGLSPIFYSSRGEYVFHLFKLYQAVAVHGGFTQVCAKSLWGHIAGSLCKVSKRQVTAAREAEGCYKEYLLPFEARLRLMGYRAESGLSKSEGLQSSCIDLVTSSESASRTSAHAQSCARITCSPSTLSQPHGSPSAQSGSSQDGRLPTRPALELTPCSSRDNRHVVESEHPPSVDAVRDRISTASLTEGRSQERCGGWGMIGKDAWERTSEQDDVFDDVRQMDTPPRRTIRRRARRRGGTSVRGGRCPTMSEPCSSSITPVKDPVSGDKVASMVRWLRELAAEVGQATSAPEFNHHWSLHLRYSGDLLRAREKVQRAARRAYRAEAANLQRERHPKSSCSPGLVLEGKRRREMTCSAAYYWRLTGRTDLFGHESESDDDDGSEIGETREGGEFQAEIPAWRPRPSVPCADEAKWLTGRIWPLPQAGDASGTEESGTSAMHQNLIPAVPRPPDFMTCIDSRQEWVDKSSRILEKLLGIASKGLGLPKIGYRVRRGWSAADELCFEQGIRCLGRDFATLRNSFLPGKDVAEVILYYYNIWKVQRSHSSRMWYAELREEKLESQRIEAAAREKDEDDRESEDERTQDIKLRLAQRRAIKTTITWIKSIGRDPLGANLVQRSRTLARAKRLQDVRRVPGADAAFIEM